jgi:transcriptional regulator with XRE-family HTH domain
MEPDFDLARFGQRLREVRSERNMTLKDVYDATGISIPTLSRVERGEATAVENKTIVSLATWANLPLTLFQKAVPAMGLKRGERAASTPDIVEIHLRADKKLNPKTAELLAKMFRAAYVQAASESKD